MKFHLAVVWVSVLWSCLKSLTKYNCCCYWSKTYSKEFFFFLKRVIRNIKLLLAGESIINFVEYHTLTYKHTYDESFMTLYIHHYRLNITIFKKPTQMSNKYENTINNKKPIQQKKNNTYYSWEDSNVQKKHIKIIILKEEKLTVSNSSSILVRRCSEI